jgi:hypothetical protein
MTCQMSLPLDPALVGGPRVVAALLYTDCNRLLTMEQAQALWQQCRRRLFQRQEIVHAAEDGASTTSVRPGAALHAIKWAVARELANLDWPQGLSTFAAFDTFQNRMRIAFVSRGYAVYEPSSELEARPYPQQRFFAWP